MGTTQTRVVYLDVGVLGLWEAAGHGREKGRDYAWKTSRGRKGAFVFTVQPSLAWEAISVHPAGCYISLSNHPLTETEMCCPAERRWSYHKVQGKTNDNWKTDSEMISTISSLIEQEVEEGNILSYSFLVFVFLFSMIMHY